MLLLFGTHSLKTTSASWKCTEEGSSIFVCNSYRQTANVSSMLSELSWPLLEQRRAEARLGLFHHIVHKFVDIDAMTLMTRSTRPTRKANEAQYTRNMTSKDYYKYSFIPRTIIQWNGIAAVY